MAVAVFPHNAVFVAVSVDCQNSENHAQINVQMKRRETYTTNLKIRVKILRVTGYFIRSTQWQFPFKRLSKISK